MKIIGTTRSGFLLDATAQEISALAGAQYRQVCRGYDNDYLTIYSEECSQENTNKLHIGDEFAISAAWEQIHRNKEREREIELIKKSLECAIHNLDMTVPFLKETPKVEA